MKTQYYLLHNTIFFSPSRSENTQTKTDKDNKVWAPFKPESCCSKGAETQIPDGEIILILKGGQLFFRKWRLQTASISIFMLMLPRALVRIEYPHIQLTKYFLVFPTYISQISQVNISKMEQMSFPNLNWLSSCDSLLDDWNHYLLSAPLCILLNYSWLKTCSSISPFKVNTKIPPPSTLQSAFCNTLFFLSYNQTP